MICWVDVKNCKLEEDYDAFFKTPGGKWQETVVILAESKAYYTYGPWSVPSKEGKYNAKFSQEQIEEFEKEFSDFFSKLKGDRFDGKSDCLLYVSENFLPSWKILKVDWDAKCELMQLFLNALNESETKIIGMIDIGDFAASAYFYETGKLHPF